MHNDLFSIGPFTIHGYGLMIAIGIIAAVIMADYRGKKRDLDTDFVFDMGIMSTIGGLIGARLLFCIVEIKSMIANPSLFFDFSSGLVVYGGIIGGILTGYLICRWKKKHFMSYFDLVMPSIALAQGFGRIGCLLAGCCYGRETTSGFGIVFTHSDYAPNNVSLIPTQIISSAGDFLIAGILVLYARKKRKDGKVAGLYLMLYSIGRFLIEFLRNDDRGSIGALSTSQFIAIFLFLAGVLVFNMTSILKRSNDSEEELEEEETEEEFEELTDEDDEVETYILHSGDEENSMDTMGDKQEDMIDQEEEASESEDEVSIENVDPEDVDEILEDEGELEDTPSGSDVDSAN